MGKQLANKDQDSKDFDDNCFKIFLIACPIVIFLNYIGILWTIILFAVVAYLVVGVILFKTLNDLENGSIWDKICLFIHGLQINTAVQSYLFVGRSMLLGIGLICGIKLLFNIIKLVFSYGIWLLHILSWVKIVEIALCVTIILAIYLINNP